MTLTDALRRGALLKDEQIIDAHAHMGPWYNFHIPHQGSADAMVRSMDLCGITTAVISPHVCIGPDYHLGNEQAFEAATRFPGRLVPFVTVNPTYGAEAVQQEIDYWHERAQIKAFKLHPGTHLYKASGENYFPVYEYANAHALPILSHSWAGDPLCGASTLGGLAAKYTKANFIIGHSASSWQVMEEGCQEAEQNDNVYLDLTGSRLLHGLIEQMVAQVGAHRVLFGTDNPFIDPRPGLGRVLMSRLNDDDKRLILSQNARKLFGL